MTRQSVDKLDIHVIKEHGLAVYIIDKYQFPVNHRHCGRQNNNKVNIEWFYHELKRRFLKEDKEELTKKRKD